MNKLSIIKSLFKTNVFDGCEISSITDDSRDAQNGSLFIARGGVGSHGINFVKEAIENGASCIISDQDQKEDFNIPFLYERDLEKMLIDVLVEFYGLQLENLLFHGITGTNGKTTTAFMAHKIMRSLSRPAVYIGTIGAIINDEIFSTKGNTTPGIFELFAILSKINTNQHTYVFLEISSHALAQKRLNNLCMMQSIILNIQSDHLDYHHTNQNYFSTKLSILDMDNKNPPIIFIDKIHPQHSESISLQAKQMSMANFLSCQDPLAPFSFEMKFNAQGTSFINLNFLTLKASLKASSFPIFNLENFISAIALIAEHLTKEDLKIIENFPIELPKGRGELLELKKGNVLIDFAHDVQSMKNILSALKDSYAEIILVFGCGGDRDKSKRPKMMKVALEFADKIFFTSDNNRNELFSSIVSDATDSKIVSNIKVVEDRGQAIQIAFQSLNKNNILVILGKGHEMFMEVSEKKLPFNDRNWVLKISNNEIN